MDASSGLVLSDKTYNRIKWLTLIALPAFAAFYFSFAQIWHLPKANEVVGSITILATLLGTLLGISTKAYNASDADGVVYANGKDEDTGLPRIGMTIGTHPDDLLGKKVVRLKVDPNAAPGVPPGTPN